MAKRKYIVKIGPCYLKAPQDTLAKDENPLVDAKKDAHRFKLEREANREAVWLALKSPVKVEVLPAEG